MISNDMMLDVTSATGLNDKTLVAATLHLPDDMSDGQLQLVFALHGGGYSRLYWHPTFADESYSFARWFTDHGKAVLTVDMLGMGESSRPEPEDCLSRNIIAAAHADALAQVVAKLEQPVGVTGIGHSMGGMMIIAQAANHSGLDRIAVLGWANEPMELGDTNVETLLSDLPASGYIPTAREPMRKLFYWPDVPLKLIEADEAHASTTPVTLGKDALKPGIVHEAAAQITLPVLIVQSVVDTSPSPQKEISYFKTASSVELQTLENAAHCQNFASTRATHWNDLNSWIDRTS
ncbi:alpha/beta hydrolase [Parasphingorhabdus sp.]|uniref:alpha/beta hydrolase n=1 Tax=Parasphingorhabdus sp. TaxID=2709688 RepID=UPI003BAE285C